MFVAALTEDLTWLGLTWDGTPRLQSAHGPEYAAALTQLDGMGLLYPCFCSRADLAAATLAPHGQPPPYPGTCRNLPLSDRAERLARGGRHAWRLDMIAAVRRTGKLHWFEEGQGWLEAAPERFGDVVLSRKDALGSYHLCAAHDDAAQGIDLVTRGEDLRPATAIHRVLQALLGWPVPAYAHHRLLADGDGRRLAKRDGAITLRAMRNAGLSAAEVLNLAGQ